MLASIIAADLLVAQIIVRKVEESVKARLQSRAKRHGRSMEEEVREILRNAAKDDAVPTAPLGSRIAARFAGAGLDAEIPEWRGIRPRPAKFGR
jgi:plasmid stability protein